MRYFLHNIVVFFALTILTPVVSQAEQYLVGCRNFEYINDNGRTIIRAICPESRLEGSPEVVKTADLTRKIGVSSDGYLTLYGERFPDSCENIHLFLQGNMCSILVRRVNLRNIHIHSEDIHHYKSIPCWISFFMAGETRSHP